LNVRIYYEDTNFRLTGWKKVREIVDKVIAKQGYVSGDLNFILTNDKGVLELNSKFLNRNYFTDVIAFEYNKGSIISGDIFISTETVKANAINYKVSYNEEMVRVMIHGVLHLCGFVDKSGNEKKEMRRMEDYWLKQWRKL
jgi:probable rRNA maturation factor